MPEDVGGGPTNPVIYPDVVIGKHITLNYQNLGPVAMYVTTATVPYDLTDSQIEKFQQVT